MIILNLYSMSNSHSDLYALMAAAMLAGGVLSTGCNPEKGLSSVPSAELSVVSTDASSAVLALTASGIADYAYVAYSEEPETEPAPVVIYRDGVTGTASDGENKITVSHLDALTSYTVYLAARTTAGEYYEDILSVTFSTSDYTEDLTLVETFYDGFTMQIRMPEEVLERGNVLRYTEGNLLMYNSNKEGWMAATDAANLEANGGLYTEESISVTYNDDNVTTGEVDEWGQEVYLHDPIVPGEPLVFLVGEFSWGESMFGWGEGWYSALFDNAAYEDALYNGSGEVNESDYWTGHFAKKVFCAKAPEKLDATVKMEADMQAKSGVLRFTPDPEVYQYCVCLLDESSYQTVLQYLENDESYLQWFTTSYYAAMMLSMTTFTGNQEVAVEDYLYLQEDTDYHVLITAMGDADGMSQSFVHGTFSTTQKQLEAPEVTVTAIPNPSGEESPYEVWFNVKNTGNVEITSAMYAANYVRDWEGALNSGMTYADITSSGNAFTSAEIAQLNTEEGYDVMFTSLDGMTTRLAVLAYNSEETANDINAENSPAIAEQTTVDQPDAPRVESELFSALEGEWTMTADVSKYDYYQGGYVDAGSQSIKVTVYDGIDDYPETLPEDVYANYSGMSKEEVDALYDEFKMESEAFNAKVRGQNRLLCLGFGYEDEGSSAFASATPYELFCSPDYSGYDVASLFYDFGPKWYLQIASDGSVSVPLNSDRIYPLQAWTDNIYYIAAFGDSGYISVGADHENEYFQVDVASDKNTITVNPIVYEGENLYPNAVYLYYANYAYLGGNRVTSALSLTRGWNASSASAGAVSGNGPRLSMPSLDGNVLSPAARPKSRTSFVSLKRYGKSSMGIVPAEEFKARLTEYSRTHRR